ncbi:MAG: hypothetical protein FH761_16620 [Firmicutes bacterium]|nr:hypothetical protein [Bacillota bacterium]
MTVEVLESTIAIDNEGYENQESFTVIETIKRVDKQPLSGEIAEKEYGISNANIKFRLFITEPSNYINEDSENTKIRIGSKFYTIRAVRDWNIHKEAVIEPYKEVTVV